MTFLKEKWHFVFYQSVGQRIQSLLVLISAITMIYAEASLIFTTHCLCTISTNAKDKKKAYGVLVLL